MQQVMSSQQIKQRHFDKVYANAKMIKCACGCGREMKAKDKYGRDVRFVNGHNNRKYNNSTQYKREWNHRNRKSRLRLKRERGHRLKSKLIKIMGGRCIVCGVKYDNFNACIFQFHHVKSKKIPITVRTLCHYAWSTILKEVEKCEIVCANCHFVIHSNKY